MRDVNRRTILGATTTAITGLTLAGTVPVVSANQREPPTSNEVTIEDENIEYVEPDPDAGFHYPYFLYNPPSFNTSEESPRPIFVEPNNTRAADNDFTAHLELAKNEVLSGPSRHISDSVGIPLLVSVFPRPDGSPEPWHFFPTHLDPDTFTTNDSPLKRVDLQLLGMIDDASSRLENDGHTIASEIHMNGFSSSGTFTNRFTLLHPERVNAASYGGIGSMILPKTELDEDIPVVGDPKWDEMSYPVGTEEDELPYPIGVANLEALTGDSFDKEAWLNIPQYIYLGDEDTPEPGTQEHRNHWNLHDDDAQQIPPDERSYAMPELIDDIYGVKRFEERFEVSRAVYENVDAAVTYTIYEGHGHTPSPAVADLIEFHTNEIQATYGSDTRNGEGSDGDAAVDATSDESPGFGTGAALAGIVGGSYLLKKSNESKH